MEIFLTVWIELVMIMIFEIPAELVAWLILHLITNNSASVLVMFTVWWRVLVMGLLQMCIWEIKVVILFSTLAFVITRAWKGLLKDLIAI